MRDEMRDGLGTQKWMTWTNAPLVRSRLRGSGELASLAAGLPLARRFMALIPFHR